MSQIPRKIREGSTKALGPKSDHKLIIRSLGTKEVEEMPDALRRKAIALRLEAIAIC